MKTYEDIINYVIRNFGHECGFTIEILYYIQWKFRRIWSGRWLKTTKIPFTTTITSALRTNGPQKFFSKPLDKSSQ